MEFEPMLTPREKSPLPENVPRGVSNPRHCGSEPKHYQLSYSGPPIKSLKPVSHTINSAKPVSNTHSSEDPDTKSHVNRVQADTPPNKQCSLRQTQSKWLYQQNVTIHTAVTCAWSRWSAPVWPSCPHVWRVSCGTWTRSWPGCRSLPWTKKTARARPPRSGCVAVATEEIWVKGIHRKLMHSTIVRSTVHDVQRNSVFKKVIPKVWASLGRCIIFSLQVWKPQTAMWEAGGSAGAKTASEKLLHWLWVRFPIHQTGLQHCYLNPSTIVAASLDVGYRVSSPRAPQIWSLNT